jgi:N utilization substance protein A
MELKEIKSALAQISEERGIPFEKVIETLELAIAAAYKKEYGKKGQIIKAKIDLETGEINFWQVKQVLSQEELEGEKKIKFNPERHILLEEAKKIDPKVKPGEEIMIPLKTQKDYGRIAAQTAKQVILQKIKEVERELIYQEYKAKEGEIVSGIVQRVEPKAVYLNIGKTLGILPKEEQVQGEFYRPGQRLKTYILKVEQTPKGPSVILSRSYPKLVSKLFELEVPEIQSGQLEIKSIAREPGSRTKIAVVSKAKEIDAIGAMVGQRGTRVGAVINELGGEKIDIILYSEKPEEYIANALSPAKVLEVKILPKNKALAIVSNEQLSLAIGKDGQNVRLAVKLTGWKIDVKSKEETEKEEVEKEN